MRAGNPFPQTSKWQWGGGALPPHPSQPLSVTHHKCPQVAPFQYYEAFHLPKARGPQPHCSTPWTPTHLWGPLSCTPRAMAHTKTGAGGHQPQDDDRTPSLGSEYEGKVGTHTLVPSPGFVLPSRGSLKMPVVLRALIPLTHPGPQHLSYTPQ